MTDRELLEKAAKAAGWTWWRSKHGYWNLTAPDGTKHTACNGWTKFDPHTGEELADSTPGDALLEVGFCPLYTAPPRREWVGLTDEEVLSVVGWERAEMYMKLAPNFPVDEAKQETLKNARAIEAKLKEKNT